MSKKGCHFRQKYERNHRIMNIEKIFTDICIVINMHDFYTCGSFRVL